MTLCVEAVNLGGHFGGDKGIKQRRITVSDHKDL